MDSDSEISSDLGAGQGEERPTSDHEVNQVPPDYVGFNAEHLSSLEFNSASEGVAYLKGLSRRIGFQLSQKGGINNNCFQLYCTYADRSRGRKKTKKTGCPFFISLVAKTCAGGVKYVCRTFQMSGT
jgi:hypothetical protein